MATDRRCSSQTRSPYALSVAAFYLALAATSDDFATQNGASDD